MGTINDNPRTHARRLPLGSCPFDEQMLMELAEVAKGYASWNELINVLRCNIGKGRVILQYPSLELNDHPGGSVGDWLTIILNVFGRAGIEEMAGKLPKSLPRLRLLARMAESMDCSEFIAEKRLLTLEHGGYLRESYGCIMFPVERLKQRED